MSSSNDLVKQIKNFFEEEAIKSNSPVKLFSDDVISLAYQKLSANLKDTIENEEDPMVISELLQNFLEVTKKIDEKGLQRQQLLVKLFEQLNKYEQSRYY